jgi:hypothetical protein
MTLRLRLAIFTSAFIAVILSAVAVSVYLLTERSLSTAVEERARQALTDLSGGAIATGPAAAAGDAYYQIVLVETSPALPADVAAIRNGVDYTQPASVRTNPTDDSLLALLPDRALQSLVEGEELAGYVTLANGAAAGARRARHDRVPQPAGGAHGRDPRRASRPRTSRRPSTSSPATSA